MMRSKVHKILTELESRGELKDLVRSGYCAPCVVHNLNIYRFVNSRIETGSTKTKAVSEAAVCFECTERKIWRVLKSFKA